MTEVEAPRRHHRSNSQLADMLYCAYQYKLKRMDGHKERPSVWTAGGSAFHTATEFFDELAFKLDQLPSWSPEDIQQIFSDQFDAELDKLREIEPDESKWRTAGRKTKDKPNGEDITWWRKAGTEFLANYIGWRQSTNERLPLAVVDGKAAVEVEVTAPMGGVPMKGFIDRVFNAGGVLLVVDLKTGSRTPETPMQLALYSLQLEQKLGQPVSYGAFYDARKGLLHEPMDLTPYTPANLGYVYQTLDATISQGLFLPNIGRHCLGCGVREHCPFGRVIPS